MVRAEFKDVELEDKTPLNKFSVKIKTTVEKLYIITIESKTDYCCKYSYLSFNVLQ